MASRTMPLLSILMPSYNSGPFLREAIESILTDSRVELIIQDCLSDDETTHILREYAGDTRVKIIREKDAGQADALNRARVHASADWIGWLNADDIYTEGSLQGILSLIQRGEAEDYSILYGDFDLIDRNGERLRAYRVSPWNWERIFRRGCYVFYGATFIKRTDLERVGGYDSTLDFCMDLDLFLKLGPAARSRKVHKTLGALRIHDTSKTTTKGREFVREAFRVRRRHRQGPIAMALSVAASFQMLIYVTAAPIRFSKPYSRIRHAKDL
jgi:glycosyltransferase involved in cell wall biosynthesis